jgi:hypothetical protein
VGEDRSTADQIIHENLARGLITALKLARGPNCNFLVDGTNRENRAQPSDRSLALARQ